MSNRALAFLILIAMCGWALGFIYYFFIANVGNLIVDVWGLEKVHIILKWEFGNNHEDICNGKCIFKWISPVNYTISASKESYKTDSVDFKLERSEVKNIKISLKREVELSEATKSNWDKILELKYKKYLGWDRENADDTKQDSNREVLGVFSSKLVSYDKAKWFRIFTFDWSEEDTLFFQDDITVGNVSYNPTDWIIIYSIWTDNLIFDLSTKMSYKLNITSKVKFVKKSWNDKYVVVADDGAYIYSSVTNDYTKNTLFDDFIILDNGKVLWLIKKDSKLKLSLLDFPDNAKNKLVLHDIATRERKVIFELDWVAEYLLFNEWIVSYADADWKTYNLKQLEIE
ncbi:MAG: hypothetical protein ACD_2C00015G0003 [uncultured bacterium (gcode 4)]|uniref:PEGA domain-containing protein n=1 Tax=uncultured bacterium (gcode 4) TaxID=1234023 RepID=K2GIJ9_9BACT|nr:MAG: hypothetical protein ACD_2C00015G0003 [uncultured bacterium (gcode 4)]